MSMDIDMLLEYISYTTIIMGIIFHILGVDLGPKQTTTLLFTSNLLLGILESFKVSSRYGIDYPAYL